MHARTLGLLCDAASSVTVLCLTSSPSELTACDLIFEAAHTTQADITAAPIYTVHCPRCAGLADERFHTQTRTAHTSHPSPLRVDHTPTLTYRPACIHARCRRWGSGYGQPLAAGRKHCAQRSATRHDTTAAAAGNWKHDTLNTRPRHTSSSPLYLTSALLALINHSHLHPSFVCIVLRCN